MASFATTGRKIVAIGRNYVEHVKELKNTVPKEPFFFLKPTTSYVFTGGKVEIPSGVVVHHEVELAVILGKGGRDIQQLNAMSHVAGYALSIDVTGRNMQEAVKKKGLPWTAAKGFDTFTPISEFIRAETIPDPHDLKLWLKVNNAFKQNGTTSDMVFRIPQLIEHVSSIMALEEGDVLLTGTPSGVGPINPGDTMQAGLETQKGETLASLELSVVAREGGYSFKGDS